MRSRIDNYLPWLGALALAFVCVSAHAAREWAHRAGDGAPGLARGVRDEVRGRQALADLEELGASDDEREPPSRSIASCGRVCAGHAARGESGREVLKRAPKTSPPC